MLPEKQNKSIADLHEKGWWQLRCLHNNTKYPLLIKSDFVELLWVQPDGSIVDLFAVYLAARTCVKEYKKAELYSGIDSYKPDIPLEKLVKSLEGRKA